MIQSGITWAAYDQSAACEDGNSPVENDSTIARNIGNRLSLSLWLVAWLIHERRQTPLKKLTSSADKIFFNRLLFYCKATCLYFIALWRLKSSRNVMFRLKATQYGYWLWKHRQCDPIWRRSFVAKAKAKANHQPGNGWSWMCRVRTAPQWSCECNFGFNDVAVIRLVAIVDISTLKKE